MSPEHILQKHLKQWVREALACPHLFLAFDRGKPAGQWTHLREKARGIRAGTPDTLLRIKDRANIWCELKAPGNKATEEQTRMGDELMALGDAWFVCWNIQQYFKNLALSAVPMHANAHFLALHHDGAVESEVAKARMKKGASSKVAKPRATSVKIARARRAGVLV
jgi:hypothetical protein